MVSIRRGGIGLCIVAGLVLGVCVGGATGSTQRSVVLAHGRIGQFSWSSLLRRSVKPARGRGNPCIAVLTEESATGEAGESYECGNIVPELPMVQSVASGSGRTRRTVLAAAFVGSARLLLLDLGNRGQRKIRLRRLSETKARQIRIAPVAYWAHAFAGPFCLHEFSVYDGAGAQLSDSGPIPCRM
jgi:hypothetical protein